MSIKSWPLDERPREKLLRFGVTTLSNAELLAVIINNGVRGKNVIELAHHLLNHYHTLQGIFTAKFASLAKQPGMGKVKYCQLQAAFELHRRYLRENLEKNNILNSNKQAQNFLLSHLKDCEQEIFACLFLDAQHHLIQYETLFHGTINYASVYPREVVKRALFHNAAAVIIAHNHPSGFAQLSEADKMITKSLQQALALVDIKLLDHILVAGIETISMAAEGLMYSE